jgi:hypothetical protein
MFAEATFLDALHANGPGLPQSVLSLAFLFRNQLPCPSEWL